MKTMSDNASKILIDALDTCTKVGINKFIIEKSAIRGIADDLETGTFILSDIKNNILDDFDSMGIGRADVLLNRINIMGDNFTSHYETKTKPDGTNIVKKLLFKNKKNTIEFSCSEPALIKAPKKFNDQYAYHFTIDKDTVYTMSKTMGAISATNISFSSEKDGSVRFMTADSEGDIFNHCVTDSYDKLLNTEHFYFNYKIKLLLPLFKQAFKDTDELDVFISERGYLIFHINSMRFYILCEV